MERFGVTAIPRDLACDQECAVAATRGLCDGVFVENVDALYGRAVDVSAGTRRENDVMTGSSEGANEVRTEKAGCAANPQASHFQPSPVVSWKTFWNVKSRGMLFDLTVPDMNSPGVGVYASRTIRENISGDVLSTQSTTSRTFPG